MSLDIISINQILAGWLVFVCLGGVVYFMRQQEGDGAQSTFFRIGPNKNLIILSVAIDTPLLYTCVICYSFINTIFRNIYYNVIKPFIINTIQNNSEDAIERRKKMSVFSIQCIVFVSTSYVWVDWLIYIHMLLAQIDMVIIESVSDVIISMFITWWWYIRPQSNKEPHDEQGLPFLRQEL